MTELENLQLGQYKLLEAIGHGGMATVYKAYQESLDRYVAVKVLLANRDPQFAARFKREARAIAALQHHNILPIYDYGEQNGLLYFVMQYVDTGVTLHDMLGSPIEPVQALRIIGHVLNALEYAHTRSVVHRDIKPANVLMPSPSWALLADFGIAKLLNDSQRLTMTGFIIGTAAYMAPEQAAGKPIDARTDLYSLGVVLYEMLTGRVPFDAETPMAMLTMHVYDPPPPPRVLNPNLSPLIESVLLRVLEKDPNQRYQSAAAMSADLERVASHLGRARPSSQITNLYQTGVEAFEQQRWDVATEQLGRLVALDPNYEDASVLLKAAQSELQRATQPRSSVSIPAPIPTPAEPPAAQAPAPEIAAMPTIAQATEKLSNDVKSGFTQASARITRAGKTATTRPGRCPNCGKAIKPQWQACPFCSAPIEPTTTQPIGQAPALADAEIATSPTLVGANPKPKRAVIVPIIAAAIILFGGGGAVAYSRANSKLPPPVVLTDTATASPTASLTAEPATPTAIPSDTPTPTATLQPTTTLPQPSATPQPTDTPRPPDALVK
ncbi:MAG: protein kinase, partial [Roseiflexaceae bacterium]